MQGAGVEFPFNEIADIAEALPVHSITYMERAIVLDPNDEDSSIFLQTIFQPHASHHEDDDSEIDFGIGTTRMWQAPDCKTSHYRLHANDYYFI